MGRQELGCFISGVALGQRTEDKDSAGEETAGRLKQEDCKFKSILSNLASPCLKKKVPMIQLCDEVRSVTFPIWKRKEKKKKSGKKRGLDVERKGEAESWVAAASRLL